jgi:adenylosuccinate synthase
MKKARKTVLVGAQWGDEGKGKIIDVLSQSHDVIVRAQGGNNAGHTVEVGKEKFVLHLIPSGILRKNKMCVISNGVVMDPLAVVKELEGLHSRKIETLGRLFISDTAHLVMPYHRLADAGRESGKVKIGTTKRGIGPAYADKAYRTGLRALDLTQPKRFAEKVRDRVSDFNKQAKINGWQTVVAEEIIESYLSAAKVLKPYFCNTVVLLHELSRKNKKMLFEGAQGTFLDIDHGTYPFVTSSNTTSGGACTGSGMPPNSIDAVLGVIKAYTTRVGEGPLVSHSNELSKRLHGMGREFGATTGRARRCGWFDAVAVRYACMVNGIDHLAVTNLDGLDELDVIPICVGYELKGKRIDYPPTDCEQLAHCKPIYEEMQGWNKPTVEARAWKQLPRQAQAYLKRISKLLSAPLDIISVGPHRDATFFVD